jgi:hypothetical protein
MTRGSSRDDSNSYLAELSFTFRVGSTIHADTAPTHTRCPARTRSDAGNGREDRAADETPRPRANGLGRGQRLTQRARR